MDCDLRVIKGPDTGTLCRLQPGINLVGRSTKSALKLTGDDISWEHFTITRNGDLYTAENLSSLGTYMDDARLVGPVRLRPRAQLRLSQDTVVRLESADGSSSGWLNDRRVLVLLLVLVLIGGGIAAVMLGGRETPNDNWNSAYTRLVEWIDRKAAAGDLPNTTSARFVNAWRLEQVENYVESRQKWLDLSVFLQENALGYPLLNARANHPGALDKLLNPPRISADMHDDEMASALMQFATRRLTYSTKLSAPKRTY